MELFNSFFEPLGAFGPVIAVGLLGFVFLALAIPMILNPREDPLDKLRRREEQRAAGMKDSSGKGGALRRNTSRDKLEKYAGFLEPQDEDQLSKTRLLLQRAGYRTRAALRMFNFLKLVLALGFLTLGIVYVLLASIFKETPIGLPLTLAWTLGPALFGYMLPKFWVNKRGEKRIKEIESGFPDALDLLLVCIEAGQSLDQAINRVAKETKTSYPALAEELELVSYESKAGKDRSSVLRDMAERVMLADVSSFVTVLIQSSQFGTPISQALRVYSAEMRDKRLMRAEEIANKLPTKMTLMTMGLTVPPLMIILVGPAVYDVMKVFGSGAITN